MKSFKIILSLLLLCTFIPSPTQAFGCYKDDVIGHAWIGKIKSGVRMRNGACVEDTETLRVLSTGEEVTITAFTEGWYQVRDNDGLKGWVGSTFVEIIDQSNTTEVELSREETKPPHLKEDSKEDSSNSSSQEKNIQETKPATIQEEIPNPIEITNETVTETKVSEKLSQKLKGHILLQVEKNGEAWYIHPELGTRFYMKDGPTAYEMMRYFGEGINNANLEKIQKGDSNLLERFAGRILLQVESHGEAFYIHPTKKTVHYLKDGPAAYQLMRELSLGITNNNLETISSQDFIEYRKKRIAAIENKNDTASETITQNPTINPSSTIIDTVPLEVSVPSPSNPNEVDFPTLEQYWLTRINNLRRVEGLRELVLDSRFTKTATYWATYMGENDNLTHTRADGKSMHDWVDTLELDFTTRGSEGGWNVNYFTENISWGVTTNSTDKTKEFLDDTISFYLSEKDHNGPHYRTIYHEDWNTVGIGIYYKDIGNGRYKAYGAFHYGSLNNAGK